MCWQNSSKMKSFLFENKTLYHVTDGKSGSSYICWKWNDVPHYLIKNWESLTHQTNFGAEKSSEEIVLFTFSHDALLFYDKGGFMNAVFFSGILDCSNIVFHSFDSMLYFTPSMLHSITTQTNIWFPFAYPLSEQCLYGCKFVHWFTFWWLNLVSRKNHQCDSHFW